MPDKLVFDIETKNTFADVGGQEHIRDLDVSMVGVYSYNNDMYYAFDEHEMNKLEDMMKNAYLLIGFASKRFDVPVLDKYFKFNLSSLPHFDILEEVEKSFGRRVGLGILAEANIGAGKTAHGLDAVDFYRNGDIEKLKEYCLQDVKITKEIYDLMKRQGYLWIPQRNTSQMEKVEFTFNEVEPPPASLL